MSISAIERLKQQMSEKNLDKSSNMSDASRERKVSSAYPIALTKANRQQLGKGHGDTVTVTIKLLPFDNGEKYLKQHQNEIRYGGQNGPVRNRIALKTFLTVEAEKMRKTDKYDVRYVKTYQDSSMLKLFPRYFANYAPIYESSIYSPANAVKNNVGIMDLQEYYSYKLHQLEREGKITKDEKETHDLRDGQSSYIVSALVIDNPFDPSQNGTIREIELKAIVFNKIGEHMSKKDNEFDILYKKHKDGTEKKIAQKTLTDYENRMSAIVNTKDPFDINNSLVLDINMNLGNVQIKDIYNDSSIREDDNLTDEQLEYVNKNQISFEDVVKNKFSLFDYNDKYNSFIDEGLTHHQALLKISYENNSGLLKEFTKMENNIKTVIIPNRLKFFDTIVSPIVGDFIQNLDIQHEFLGNKTSVNKTNVINAEELTSKLNLETLTDIKDIGEVDVTFEEDDDMEASFNERPKDENVKNDDEEEFNFG